ncbi:MAG: hypothetical protein WEC00_09560 [Dongiaceae bacterium]
MSAKRLSIAFMGQGSNQQKDKLEGRTFDNKWAFDDLMFLSRNLRDDEGAIAIATWPSSRVSGFA